MIRGFTSGRYYRYTGSEPKSFWNLAAGCMGGVLDGQWRKCIHGEGASASFDNLDKGKHFWAWDNGYLNDWEERLPEMTISEDGMFLMTEGT